MSKFNISVLIYLILVLSIFFSGKQESTYTIIIAVTIAYLLFLVYASLNIKLNFYLESFNSFKAKGNEVAITFDDGPFGENTNSVLKVLSEHDIQATFFCIGKNIESYPETLNSILNQGHTVGNHGFEHQNLMPLRQTLTQKKDIEKCNEVIEKISGEKNQFYRPPFGVTNPRIADSISQLNLKPIGWNVRSLDTLTIPPDLLAQRILRKVKPGAIILLHDCRSNSSKILEIVVRRLKDKNYKFITIDEAISRG